MWAKAIAVLAQEATRDLLARYRHNPCYIFAMLSVTSHLSDQGTFTPVGAQGGPMEPLKKTTFPREFSNEIGTIYVWTIKNHNSGIKCWKCCTVSKWRPNNRFSFCIISILAKIWKTTFPKEFFNEIWLKVGKHEYILRNWNNILKKLFRFKMAAKTMFWYCAIMLIYAN